MTPPSTVVFDAEPLVAYADDEPGSETVSTYLEAVLEGRTTGMLNRVNATEVRYIIARKYDRETADTFLTWLKTIGISFVDIDVIWDIAADYVLEYNPALGDAYALATAENVAGTLLIGGDGDYNGITDVAIERFRDRGV